MIPAKLYNESIKAEDAFTRISEVFMSPESLYEYIDSESRVCDFSKSKIQLSVDNNYKILTSWYTSELYKKWRDNEADRIEIESKRNMLKLTLFMFAIMLDDNKNKLVGIKNNKKSAVIKLLLDKHLKLFYLFEKYFVSDSKEKGNSLINGMELVLPEVSIKALPKRISAFCKKLITLKLINERAENDYYNFFFGVPKNTKIDWPSQIYILRYIISELKKNNLFKGFNKSKTWPRVAECFTIQGQPIENSSNLRTNNEKFSNPSLKEAIDKAIFELVA